MRRGLSEAEEEKVDASPASLGAREPEEEDRVEHHVPDDECNNPSRVTPISYGPILTELSDVRFSCPWAHEQGLDFHFARVKPRPRTQNDAGLQ